jgi:sugar phosphate isomerase/epimerase
LFNAVAEAGFDYVELPLSGLSVLTASELQKLKKSLTKIPCRACNLFFPPGLAIVGENTNTEGIKAYLEKMLPLVADMGVETLVFGNGGARKIPQGATRESIWGNLRALVEILDEYAVKTGIIIAVEPLNSTETNIITSYGEAAQLTSGLSNVATMIDSYHVAMEKQNFNDVLENPQQLKHLHTAYPAGRLVPSPQDGTVVYTEFVSVVKQVGYDNKISIEGALRTKNPSEVYDEVVAALSLLRNLFGNLYSP